MFKFPILTKIHFGFFSSSTSQPSLNLNGRKGGFFLSLKEKPPSLNEVNISSFFFIKIW